PVPLTSQKGAEQPSWSPDGKWIIYLTNRTSKMTLWKIPAGGAGQPVQLAPERAGFFPRPKWSPRGEWIVLGTDQGIALVSPDGSRNSLVSTDPEWVSYGFSKDGAQVLGIRFNHAHHFTAVAIDIATRRERIVS